VAERPHETCQQVSVIALDPLVQSDVPPSLVLERFYEGPLEVHFREGVVAVGVAVVLDQYPPHPVGGDTEVGVELLPVEPILDLSESVSFLIEFLVQWFGLDEQTARIDVVVRPE